MERVLCSQEISAIEERFNELPSPLVYDITHPILFFPVRHHSPCCAFHLKKAIAEYRPDCILIEGPENAQDLIPVLVHKETKPPLALYYAYRDKGGLVSPEKEDYKCYYPFLDYSPELVALREAAARGIPASFIDLPYQEILIGTAKNRGVRQEGEKQTYNDDYLLSRSLYLKRLCEKTGLRSFEELWEKYFEIQGLRQETSVFVRQMLTYCVLSRQHTPKEELEEDGCLLREQYMVEQIVKASKTYGKILVVTGGFHTYGLWELLQKKNKPLKLHTSAKNNQEVYPMSYSMEAADALNGYASGMQSPGFYQQVWQGLEEGEKPEGAYEEAVLYYLAATGKAARQKGEGISSYDEICAYSMARGLAALRGKQEPGLYELRDSALSSFVKGEYSLSTDGTLRILQKLVTGQQVGKLCADARRPPLLEDFEEQCRFFGIKLHSVSETEVTLEIFSKEKHLRMSRFLYQTEFLGCQFAKRKKGSDLVGRRDRNRVREIWIYKWSGQITAALIDASISGGTLQEAVRSLLYTGLAKSTGCKEAAELLVKGFLMGLQDEQTLMQEHLSRVLATDGDFFSLARGFSHLLMLAELQDLYRVRQQMDLEGMIRTCFQKLIQLLPSMGKVGEENQQECMECLRILYQATGKKAYQELQPFFIEALELLLSGGQPQISLPSPQRLLQASQSRQQAEQEQSQVAQSWQQIDQRVQPIIQPGIQPGIEGTVLGLLYGYHGEYGEWIAHSAQGYLRGTEEMLKKSAAFLRGLFFTARDFVFVSQDFLRLVDELLERLPAEEFLKLLPELRMAFAYFTPMETDRIAGQAAAFHGKTGAQLLKGRNVDPLEYAYGEELNAYAEERMGEDWI